MAEGRGGSRWSDEQIERGAQRLLAIRPLASPPVNPLTVTAARAKVLVVLDAVFPVGEPDEQEGTVWAVDGGQVWHSRRSCWALRRSEKEPELVAIGAARRDLAGPCSRCVGYAAGEDSGGEPDDERLVEKVAGLMRRQEGEHRGVQWNLPVYRKRARAVVVAVRAAGVEEPDGD